MKPESACLKRKAERTIPVGVAAQRSSADAITIATVGGCVPSKSGRPIVASFAGARRTHTRTTSYRIAKRRNTAST